MLALGAALLALGPGCSSGGGGGGFFARSLPFSAQLLPLQIDATTSGAGDVAFLGGGDALLVGGGGDTILRVSRTSGAVTTFASDVTGDAAILVSIAVDPTRGTVYAGSDAGTIYVVDDEGGATILDLDIDALTGRVNGLAFAPSGFGDVGGQLIVASEADGIVAVDPDPEAPTRTDLDASAAWSDLAFLDGVLYALDRVAGEIRTLTAAGEVGDPAFATGFTAPDGLAADAVNRQLLVADPATGTLLAVTVPGEPEEGEDPEAPVVTPIARYPFDPDLPSGLAFDGVRNLLFVTDDLAGTGMTLRGVSLPGLDPDSFGFDIAGTNDGFGGLLLDLDGNLVGTGNSLGAEPGDDSNFVFRVRRSDLVLSIVAQDVGDAAEGESLLGITLDPATGTLYVGTTAGNVFAINSGGASLFATLPENGDGEVVEDVVDLAIAPASFGPVLGGHLVVVTAAPDASALDPSGGRVYTIDPASPTPVELATTPGENDLTGLVFASDGTLYVLDQDAGEIVTITPAGVVAPFASGLGLPEGIAIDEGGGRLLVADPGEDPGDDALWEVPLDGSAPTPITEDFVLSTEFGFAGGYFPSGLAFDGLGTLLLLTDEDTGAAPVRVEAFTLFPSPEA